MYERLPVAVDTTRTSQAGLCQALPPARARSGAAAVDSDVESKSCRAAHLH
jgi:hypothetical protein